MHPDRVGVPRDMATTDDLIGTRDSMQRVASHILARRRHDAVGRFGLRAVPGGIATPAFGPDDEVLRLAGTWLVVESRAGGAARSRALSVPGRSLAELADFAGADLDQPLSLGHDTPPVGDPEVPIVMDAAAAAALIDWFELGTRALDAVLVQAQSPAVVQLWPEHFDLAVDVATGTGRVNLGASPGDGFHATPYLYVGPWTADRPGDPGFWNAPFGAELGSEQVTTDADPVATASAFFTRGLTVLA